MKKKLLCLLLALTLAIPCQMPVFAAETHTDTEPFVGASVDEDMEVLMVSSGDEDVEVVKLSDAEKDMVLDLEEAFESYDATQYESEPNNNQSTANSITPNGNYVMGMKNSTSDTLDYYKFYAQKGYSYQVALVSDKQDVRVYCENGSGTAIGKTNYQYKDSLWTRTVDFTVAAAGYCYIKVSMSLASAGSTYMVGVFGKHTCSYDTYVKRVAPTCTEQGYDVYACSLCAKTTNKNYVNAKGHTPGPAATCTTAQTCTTCGTVLVSSGNHKFPENTTCTEKRVCTICGTEVEAKGHTPGAAATCTTPQTCTSCGTILVNAKGHTPGAAATCTTAQTCTICGTTLVSAKGHTPGAAATCSTPQTCTTCGAVVKAATGCIADVTGHCKTCGKIVQGNGTTMSSPVTVEFGKTYSKTWTKDTDHLNHYVRFNVDQRGIVTVKATKPYDSEGEYGKIYFVVYDVDGNAVMSSDSYYSVDNAKAYYEFSFGLEPGTYYMTMLPGFYVKSGVIETNYSVSHKPTQYCEIEPNDSASQATQMTLGQMYKGFFGPDGSDYEETDYYKLSVLKGHTYRITVDNFSVINRTSTLVYLVQGGANKSFKFYLPDKVDSNGLNYYEFTAQRTETAYIYFDNYNKEQYWYGLKVTDVSKGSHQYTKKVTPPTCVSQGYTTHTCKGCGDSYKDTYVPATGVHTYEGGTTCKYCNYQYTGKIYVERIKGKDRYATSLEIAKATKKAMGVEKFDTVIIASGTGFADALAGSYLAKVKNAPILMTNGSNNSSLVSYVKSNLKAGGKIYILGGNAAVPQSTENAMNGIGSYDVKRIKGKDRYATNIEILKEAGVTNEDIIVATGTNFADSLSASAVGLPILLVDGKKSLTADQKAYLKSIKSDKFYVVGGTGAVSEAMFNQVDKYGDVERVKGASRYETSVAIAKKFFDKPEIAVLAYAENYPDGLCGGPLALSVKGPLVLTKTGEEKAAKEYVKSKTIKYGKVLGGTSLIDDKTAQTIFNVDIIGY